MKDEMQWSMQKVVELDQLTTQAREIKRALSNLLIEINKGLSYHDFPGSAEETRSALLERIGILAIKEHTGGDK
jgi:hypothetical protein